jgi:hypothetical protein
MASTADAASQTADNRAGRGIGVLPIAIGALVVLGLIVAVIALRRPQATYPAGSPQRAVQHYLSLLQAGKVEMAYRMTDFPMSSNGNDITDAQFHEQWDNWGQTSHTVNLVRTVTSGNRSAVTVDDSPSSTGFLSGSNSGVRFTFTLLHGRHGWLITGPAYAYLP